MLQTDLTRREGDVYAYQSFESVGIGQYLDRDLLVTSYPRVVLQRNVSTAAEVDRYLHRSVALRYHPEIGKTHRDRNHV